MAQAAQKERYSTNGVSKRKRYQLLRDDLWTERSSFDSHYRDLGDFIMPRRMRFYTSDRNKGDKRNQKIIDSTGTFAARTLRSGLHAGITSPARPWLKLTTPDPSLAEHPPVKEWLNTVTHRMLAIFHGTNLYNALPILYGDMGVFATGAMSVLEDEQDLFRCYPYPIGSYAIGCDHRGVVNTFVREWEMTVLQVVEEFGLDRRTNEIDWSNISTAVRNLWDHQNYNAKLEVCWVVAPNIEADGERFQAKYKPFASCHIEKGQEREDKFLRESGFDEFPILSGRWERSGEDTYGTDCPGMTALGDIKQLQTGERRSAQAVEKMLNPPLQAPTHVKNQKASLLPADITYVDIREGQKGITPIHEVNFAIDKHEGKQEACRHRIRRAFFEDLFLMLATSDPMRGAQPPTAREIDERHEEKLLALGPVLEGTNDDVLDRLIDRVFAIMDRKGLIPPPPPILDNVRLKVEYISLLAQAQKLVGVAGHERFMNFAINSAQAFPQVLYKVNAFRALEDEAEMLGVAPDIVKSDEVAEQEFSQAQKAQAAALAAKAMKDASGATKNMADSSIEEGTALSEMRKRMEGG